MEAANEPEASDDEEAPAEAEAVAAFVPFRMDPAFGRHLAALFGDPHPLQGPLLVPFSFSLRTERLLLL